MMHYTIEQLIDLEQIQQLLESHHRLSGMAYGLFDPDENNLIAVGWQDICTRFHRVHPVTALRCRESDALIKAGLFERQDGYMEYRCKNGMIDIAIPVIIDNRHVATFFTGQFFYNDDLPDREFFVTQAAELGLDAAGYLDALDRVPVFSREHVQGNLLFLYNMVRMMAEMGLKNIRLAHEMEERKAAQAQLEDERLLLQTLIQTLPDPVWLKDPNGTFLACNGAFGLLFNDTPDSIVGRRDNDYVGDELATFFQEKDREAIAAGQPSTNEEWLTYASDGRHVLWETTKTPVYDAQGQAVGVLGIARDITRHRLLEDELRSQKRYQQALLDNFPFMVWLKDTESRLLAVNRPYLATAGVADDYPYFGKTDLDLFPKEFAEQYRADDQAVMASGQKKMVEELVGSPGQLRWHETYKAPVRDVDGCLLGTVGFARDITERKQMEEALHESEQRLQLHIRNTPVAVIEWDADFRVVSWNPAAEKIFGYSASEALGRHAEFIVPVNIRPQVDRLMNDLLHCSGGERSTNTNIAGDGRELVCDWYNTSLVTADGQVIGIASLVQDITERKRMEEALVASEREFRTLAENSPDNIARFDKHCRQIYLNPTMEKTFGLDPAWLLGKTPIEQATGDMPRDLGIAYEQCIRNVLESGEPGELEMLMPNPAGGVDTHLIRIVAERDMEGKIIGALAIGRDISAIKRAEQRLQLMNFALDHVGEAAYLIDEQGRFKYVNEKACQVMGYSREELLALSVMDIDPDFPVERWPDHWRGLKYHGSLVFEVRHMAADGHIFPAEICANYIEFCGQGFNLAMARDITERKQAEQRLQLMNFALDHVGESALLVDEQGRFRYVNEAACRVLGFSRDELLTLTVGDIDPDMPMECWPNHFQGLKAIGSNTFEGRHKAKDGRIFPVEINANYFEFCGQGYNLGLVRDISERKQAEHQLMLMNFAVDRIGEAAFLIDEQGCFHYVNEEACRILKCSRSELLSRSVADIDPDMPSGAWPSHWLEIKSFGIVRLLGRHMASDGFVFPVEISCNYFEFGGQEFSLALVRDITERKQIEQALQDERNLFIGGPNVAFRWRAVAGWPVEYVSPNITAQFGYTPEDFTSGRVPYGSIIHPEDQQRVAEEVSGYCAVSASYFEQEYRVLHADGSWRWIYDFTVVVRDTNGTITHFHGYIIDITGRKRAEQELHEREQQFRALAENLPDPVFRYDRDCRRLYVNPAVSQILAKPQQQLIGNMPDDGASLAGDESRRMLAAIRQVFEQNEQVQLTVGYVAVDGQQREYQMLLVPEHDAQGQVATVLSIGHDITAIRAVEQRLTRFVNNVPGFVFSYRMTSEGETSFPFASPGVKDIFGVAPEEIQDIRSLLRDVVSPDDLLHFDAVLIESAWNMRPFRDEFRLRRPGMPERWISVYATPERETDRSTLWHGIMLDITERRMAEEALRERERRFRTLIDSIPDHITGFDVEGRVRYINPAVTRDFGVATDMIAGMTLEELSAAGAAPEGGQFPAAIRRVIEERTPNSMEVIWQTLHGKRLFEVHHIPELDVDGTVTGVLGLARDITERMEMEASLRKSRYLLEEAQRIAGVGSWELELGSNRLTWSDEILRMFEMDQESFAATYDAFLQRVHPDDREMVDQAYKTSLANRTPYNIEHRLLFPDGQVKYVHERCETYYGADGTPLRSLGTVQDITERKLTEETLRSKQRKLAELELELSFAEERERQRIATVLHDHIGQLLLMGRIKLGALLSAGQPPATEQTVSDVRTLMDEAIQSTRSLTVQLCPPVLSTMGLEPALELLCRQMLEEWELQVAFSDDQQSKPLSPEVRTVLYQTARELLINVGKHAGTNRAQLAISRDDALFVMTVSDSGAGFDPDALAAASRQAKGFGLFNVMRRIRNLGGEMTMDSSPLQGTRIIIRLPLAIAEEGV